MIFSGLWVDDVRLVPEHLCEQGWTQAVTFHEAILKLELMQFESVSLDHDLASFYGNKEMTGYDIAMWLAERRQEGLFVPSFVYVHSANPVGHDRIQAVIDRYLS